MEIRQTLIDISNDARSWLKTWAGGFTQEHASDSGGTKTNPIAWQLGHLACVEDDVFRLFTGERGIVPDDVRAVCASGCPTPTAATRYPPVSELWSLLDRTHGRLTELIEDADDFDSPPLEENRFFHSLGQAVYEAALHENYHVGEIATLRKALGLSPIG
jgi:hypothetical protein